MNPPGNRTAAAADAVTLPFSVVTSTAAHRTSARAPGSSSTLNDLNQHNHDRDDQEDMNESAQRIRGDESERPQNNQDNSDSPEHFASPFLRRPQENLQL
jgi:hypothetical protein